VDAFGRRCRVLARKLVAAHSRCDAEELDRQRAASKVKRWTDKVTGMAHTHLQLDPLRDQILWKAINHHLGRLRQQDQSGSGRTPWAQLQVDAVIAAVNTSDGDGALRVPEIGVLVDYTMLTADAATAGLCNLTPSGVCETVDGTPLPVSTVRRMCCDADIYPIVMSGDGRPLDAGRTRRTATVDQRRALAAMYARCGFGDCGVGFDNCRIHHIEHWLEHHGPTDLDNLIPACDTHHHLVHEGHWTVTMTADRIATWRLPNGTIHHTATTNRRQPT
jgi:hypothetical protein